MSKTRKHTKTFGTLKTERRCREFMDKGGFERFKNRLRQEAEISDMMETQLYKEL